MNPVCVLVRDPRHAVGGFETWTETLARGLPGRGVRTIVLVPGNPAEVAARLGSAELLPIEPDARPERQAALVLASLAALAAQELSGVFFTMGYPYMNIAGLNLRDSPWLAVPVMHGRHPSAFEWIAAGPPAKIVVPSAEFAQEVRRELRRRARWFRAVGRVVTIPHGVAVPSIEAKSRRAVGKPLRVVAVTRLDDDTKRPFDLVRIAERARERGVEMHLQIAGTGPALTSMRGAAGPNVTFLDAVPHQRIAELLLDADVLLSTSESEAFGLSVAEAMACGCAVVSGDIEGPVREMVTASTGRRVPVGDIDAFVAAIAEAGPQARALGRAGHELIASRYEEAAMLDRYASLLRSLSSRCRPDRDWRPPSPPIHDPSALTLPPLLTRLRRTLGR